MRRFSNMLRPVIFLLLLSLTILPLIGSAGLFLGHRIALAHHVYGGDTPIMAGPLLPTTVPAHANQLHIRLAWTWSYPSAHFHLSSIAPHRRVLPRGRILYSNVLGARSTCTDPLGCSLINHIPPFPTSFAAPFTLPSPPVLSRAAFLYDAASGATLYERNADQRLPIASTTKIMTALVAITHGHLDDWVTASQAAATIGQSTMYLQQGERLRLRDLLYGLMLPSGNDAAIAIAEHVGGSVPHFVAMMNQEAALLDMTHTHFTTPHGLDADGHFSSARDMARLTVVAMRQPLFRQIVSTHYYTIPATSHNVVHNLININQPLWWYPGTIGVKPGTTEAAGRCAVEWVVHGKRALLLVVLGDVNLVTDMRNLLNWGFDDFSHWYSPQQAPVVYAPEYFGWDGPGLWVPLAGGGRYFALTGHTLRSPLLDAYLRGGGFSRYGAPTSEAFREHGLWRQRFAAAWLFYNAQTKRASSYAQKVE